MIKPENDISVGDEGGMEEIRSKEERRRIEKEGRWKHEEIMIEEGIEGRHKKIRRIGVKEEKEKGV